MAIVNWVLLPFKQFVQLEMICAILSALSDEEIRLYTVRSNGLSVHQPHILPSWFDSKRAILARKAGKEIVYVDLPMSLLFCASEPLYSSDFGCYIYKLKGPGLKFAKRSHRKCRVA